MAIAGQSVRQLMEDLEPTALNLIVEGWPHPEILVYLSEQGCSDIVAGRILENAKRAARRRYRTKGAVIAGIGVVLILVTPFARMALLIGPLGVFTLLFGLYYLLTGRRVEED